jgi:asparagine synthase (glutamine-hydrolysing)
LRQAVADLVPRTILARRKQGFSVPISSWLRGELRSFTDEVLSEEALTAGKVFDPRTVRRLLSEHRAGQRDHGQLLWTILSVELWRHAFGASL